MPDLLGALGRALRCSRGQAATVLLGLLVAVPTFVASVVGVQHGPPDTSPRPSVTETP